MLMKKKLIGALVLGTIAGAAHADDGNYVELYGLLDTAVGYVDHSLSGSPVFPSTVNPVSATSATKHLVGMFAGGESMSRWGMRGSENLGGGWSTFFDLESAINLPTGTSSNAAASIAGPKTTVAAPSAINGQLFSRGAFVGLHNDQYGSLSFGRQTALSFDVINAYDPTSAAQLFSPIGFSGSYSAGGITEGSRQDNAVKYKGQFGPVNFGVSYAFGNETTFGAGSSWNAALGYEANGFGVEGTYYADRDTLHAGSTGSGLGDDVGNVGAYDDHGAMIVAKYNFGPATAKAGYEHYQLTGLNQTAEGAYATDSYFGYTYATINAVGKSSSNNLYFVGGDYKITPAFDVAVGVYDTQETSANGNSEAGGNQWQYSLLADYKLSRRTDIYAGYMFSKYNGAEFNGDQRDNYIVATGLRTQF